MGSRLELQAELQTFLPKVYYQPPSTLKMEYPCIVYKRFGKLSKRANNGVYLRDTQYQITLIERDPDSNLADQLEDHFASCVISQNYTVDNLHHTTLNLYY